VNQHAARDAVLQAGAASDAGQCFGMAQYQGQPFTISVFGDDITTASVDGFENDEEFHLMLYRNETGETQTLDALYDLSMPNSNTFAGNGISAVTGLKAGATGISQPSERNIVIQPNPSNGMFRITGIESIQKITILTPEGEKVYEQKHNGTHSMDIDVSGLSNGVYLIRLESNDLPVIKKLMIH